MNTEQREAMLVERLNQARAIADGREPFGVTTCLEFPPKALEALGSLICTMANYAVEHHLTVSFVVTPMSQITISFQPKNPT